MDDNVFEDEMLLSKSQADSCLKSKKLPTNGKSEPFELILVNQESLVNSTKSDEP